MTPARRGISMLETVIATAIAGSVLAASIAAAGATATRGSFADDRGQARIIAAELIEEMTSKPYSADTEETVATLNAAVAAVEAAIESLDDDPRDQGDDQGQSQSQNKGQGLFNTLDNLTGDTLDVLDETLDATLNLVTEDTAGAGRASRTNFRSYHGLEESPPTGPTGDELPGAQGLTRTVEIIYLDPADPSREVATDQGLALAKIRILRGATLLHEACIVRARALDEIPVQ